MADGILGLGSSGSADLSSDLIEKLQTAETTAIVDPITEDIEETELEIEAVEEIEAKILELLDVISVFDLYTTDTNVFDEVTATTSGDAATFDATDTSKLEAGTISVTINQLAQKDVYQSELIDDIESDLESGTLTITVGEDEYSFSTSGKSYEDLIDEMNTYDALDVSLEQVSDDSYRMVLKSSESGLSNELSITTDTLAIGFNEDGNHVLEAQNMFATVDGIDYDLSQNQIALQNGLTITVVEEGDASIVLTKDTTNLIETIEEIAEKYNELVDLIDSNIYGDEDETAVISDSTTLRTIMSTIKGMFYDNYGLDDKKNAFNYGISFDSDGYMQVDSTVLSDAVTNDYDNLKELFVGYAESEGIGTRLKTYLDGLDGYNGILTTFDDKLSEQLEDLNTDKEDAIEDIDDKYSEMALRFAEYTVIITQMENEFAALEAIIDADD